MKITFDLSEINDLISSDEIMDYVIDEIDDTTTSIYASWASPPPTGVAVDTGEARNSIQIDRSNPLKPEVYSTAPHMQRLEDGWSPQSDHAAQRAIDEHTD